MAAFARDRDIDPQRLGWWRDRLPEPESSSLLPVTITGSVCSAVDVALRVEVHGVAVEVVDPERASPAWVAELVTRLRRSDL